MKAFYTLLTALMFILPSFNRASAQSPQGMLSPDEIFFEAFVGDSVATYFEVINTGTVPFYHLSALTSDYGFIWVYDNGLPDYIQPGESGQILATYKPELPGVHHAHYSMKIGDSFHGVNLTGTAYIRGDVNNDGKVDITDVVALIDFALKDNEATFPTDLNGDGQVTITDVVRMIDMLLNEGGEGNTPEPAVFEDEVFEVEGCTFKMIAVEGGTFNMGGDYYESVMYHQVTLDDYHIGETEVTQELWDAVMGSNPSVNSGYWEWPVEYVSWNDCQQFITKLNQKTGRNFRLPTEAEWEFAARGGNKTHGYTYSGSNNFNDVAWCEDNSSDRTQAVGSKQPNELGTYDMSGNVWEWCQDWYAPYTSQAQTNPTGPETGSEHIVRGGCMCGHSRFCSVFYRMYYEPTFKRDEIGLRLAL